MKKLKWIFLGLGAICLVIGAMGLRLAHAIEIEQLSDDLWVLYGAGGNVAVLRTGEGTVIVDTMTLSYQGERIRDIAEELTGSAVVMIINSHYHLDHTHGNPAFPVGTRVLSSARTLDHLNALDAEYFSGSASALLPNETFSATRRLQVGNKNLTLYSPGRGHTDGDIVVLFEQERVVHAGDLFFNKHYPNIDLEAGGSVQRWSSTIENIFDLDFDRVIAGHGPTASPEELRNFQRFTGQLAELARSSASGEEGLEQFLLQAQLDADAGYTEIRMLVSLGLDREFVLTRAWQEVHNEYQLLTH